MPAGWLQWLTPAGILGAVAIAVAAYFKQRPPMKLAELQGEAQLWAEIGSLRDELKRERELCDERIDRIEKRHEQAVAELNGQILVFRHERNNLRACFNAMIAMLKQEGADISRVVATIEDMMARGDEVVAKEKAALIVGPKGESE